MKRKKTVLVVVAHADDMEFKAAGTVARFVEEFGYDVYEYILTDNSKGSYRLSPQELVNISAKEAARAALCSVCATYDYRVTAMASSTKCAQTCCARRSWGSSARFAQTSS